MGAWVTSVPSPWPSRSRSSPSRGQLQQAVACCRQLREDYLEARFQAESLPRQVQYLETENERLSNLLEVAQRAAKRQAAPFSKRRPKS